MRVGEIIDRLAERLDVTRHDAQEIYLQFMEVLCDALVHGEEFRLQGLGRFVPYVVSPKQGRPQSAQDAMQRVIEVKFLQCRSSREQLARKSPILEQVSSVIKEPDHVRKEKRSFDRGLTHVRLEPHGNLEAAGGEEIDGHGEDGSGAEGEDE